MAKNDGTRLATALHKALRGSKSAVDAGLLLGELMQVWGGPARLARDMYAEFEAAPKGSMVRQRMMEAVQRLVVQATDRDQTKVMRPETMTDEDLEASDGHVIRAATSAHAWVTAFQRPSRSGT